MDNLTILEDVILEEVGLRFVFRLRGSDHIHEIYIKPKEWSKEGIDQAKKFAYKQAEWSARNELRGR